MSYLVDSDWLIDALAGIPSATETLTQLSDERLAVSIVTVGEVLEGAYLFSDSSSHLARFRQFLGSFPVLTLNEPIIELFAHYRAALRRRGLLIPDFDLLIAATALHHDLTLITRNGRHFGRLPALRLYRE